MTEHCHDLDKDFEGRPRYRDMFGQPMSHKDWGIAVENGKARIIGSDRVKDKRKRRHHVSTVWLGLDHQWGHGPPLIFETMVFCEHGEGCDLDDWQERYSTLLQAQQGHRDAVAMVELHGKPWWAHPALAWRPKKRRGE